MRGGYSRGHMRGGYSRGHMRGGYSRGHMRGGYSRGHMRGGYSRGHMRGGYLTCTDYYFLRHTDPFMVCHNLQSFVAEVPLHMGLNWDELQVAECCVERTGTCDALMCSEVVCAQSPSVC